MSVYEYDVLDSVQFCDKEHLVRLAQTYSLFKSPDVLQMFWRIEKRALELIDELDTYDITNIIRSFTRTQGVVAYGKDSTFVELEQRVMKHFDQFDFKSLSYVMHAYGLREQGNPGLHKRFLKAISDQDQIRDYQTISNIVYYLMFTDNKDQELWTKIVREVLRIDAEVPVRCYKPLKISKYYLRHNLPDIDIEDYTTKFFHTERYWSVTPRENQELR